MDIPELPNKPAEILYDYVYVSRGKDKTNMAKLCEWLDAGIRALPEEDLDQVLRNYFPYENRTEARRRELTALFAPAESQTQSKTLPEIVLETIGETETDSDIKFTEGSVKLNYIEYEPVIKQILVNHIIDNYNEHAVSGGYDSISVGHNTREDILDHWLNAIGDDSSIINPLNNFIRWTDSTTAAISAINLLGLILGRDNVENRESALLSLGELLVDAPMIDRQERVRAVINELRAYPQYAIILVQAIRQSHRTNQDAHTRAFQVLEELSNNVQNRDRAINELIEAGINPISPFDRPVSINILRNIGANAIRAIQDRTLATNNRGDIEALTSLLGDIRGRDAITALINIMLNPKNREHLTYTHQRLVQMGIQAMDRLISLFDNGNWRVHFADEYGLAFYPMLTIRRMEADHQGTYNPTILTEIRNNKQGYYPAELQTMATQILRDF